MVECSRTVTALEILEMFEPIGFPSHNASGCIPTGKGAKCLSRPQKLPTFGCQLYSRCPVPFLLPSPRLYWATALAAPTYRDQLALVLPQVQTHWA